MDWLAALLCLVSVELIAKKYWIGWLIGGLNSCLLLVINIQYELYGLAIVSVIFVVRQFMAMKEWKREKDNSSNGVLASNGIPSRDISS